jgi:hypothetical protein
VSYFNTPLKYLHDQSSPGIAETDSSDFMAEQLIINSVVFVDDQVLLAQTEVNLQMATQE